MDIHGWINDKCIQNYSNLPDRITLCVNLPIVQHFRLSISKEIIELCMIDCFEIIIKRTVEPEQSHTAITKVTTRYNFRLVSLLLL